LVLEARVHSAQIQNREGIKLLLDIAAATLPDIVADTPRRRLGYRTSGDAPASTFARIWVRTSKKSPDFVLTAF
jgi:hypothetical protein